jgi:hypothetical protein
MRIAAMFLIFAASAGAQAHAAHRTTASRANADQLGMTCNEILQIRSSDWVNRYTAIKGQDSAATIRALGVYGNCYDRRTDELAAKLARTGKGPSPRERANFLNVEKALRAFTVKTLAEAQPATDPVKTAYAGLYEKEFRYVFYEAYEPKPAPPAPPDNPKLTGGSAGSTKASSATSTATSAGNKEADASADKAATAVSTDADSKETNAGPLTLAKNRFGALLGDLPDDKMHEVHESFGEILGPNSASPQMQLLVYQYAIFLLESPTDKPFSPPPF